MNLPSKRIQLPLFEGSDLLKLVSGKRSPVQFKNTSTKAMPTAFGHELINTAGNGATLSRQ